MLSSTWSSVRDTAAERVPIYRAGYTDPISHIRTEPEAALVLDLVIDGAWAEDAGRPPEIYNFQHDIPPDQRQIYRDDRLAEVPVIRIGRLHLDNLRVHQVDGGWVLTLRYHVLDASQEQAPEDLLENFVSYWQTHPGEQLPFRVGVGRGDLHFYEHLQLGELGPRIDDIRIMQAALNASTVSAAEAARAFAAALNARSAFSNEAEAKARALLLRMLSPDNRKLFEERGYFEARGQKTRHQYDIHQKRQINIFNRTKGYRLCYVTPDVPICDQLVAQKLLIESDEEHFLSVAARWN